MTDERTYCYTLHFCQGGTELNSFYLLSLDGGRLSIPFPNSGKIIIDELNKKVINYHYYYANDKTSDKLMKFLYEKNKTSDKIYAYNQLKKVILFFKSEIEKIVFEKYIINQSELFFKKLSKISDFDNINVFNKEQTENYKILLRQALILNELLQEFRRGRE